MCLRSAREATRGKTGPERKNSRSGPENRRTSAEVDHGFAGVGSAGPGGLGARGIGPGEPAWILDWGEGSHGSWDTGGTGCSWVLGRQIADERNSAIYISPIL